jgi:hypothetical protein
MAITLTSDDERASVAIDADVPRTAARVVVADKQGREFHFGNTRIGTFAHVATYTPEGREPYAWWFDFQEALEGACTILEEPQLGPRVSKLTDVALTGLARRCNVNNGFHSEPEKKWAVEVLRALWEEAREPLDADELAVWIATHGWAPKHARKFRELVEGVKDGRGLRGAGGRAIRRDSARAAAMVQHWRDQIEDETG